MGHSGGSRSGGTAVVHSMRSMTATGWHLVQQFYENRRPSALEAAAGTAFSKGAAASAPACRTYSRSHGSQKDTGPSDEDGLLERLKGRRGAVLWTVHSVQPLPTKSRRTSRRAQSLSEGLTAYDGRVKKLHFKVNDLVWFFCPRK